MRGCTGTWSTSELQCRPGARLANAAGLVQQHRAAHNSAISIDIATVSCLSVLTSAGLLDICTYVHCLSEGFMHVDLRMKPVQQAVQARCHIGTMWASLTPTRGGHACSSCRHAEHALNELDAVQCSTVNSTRQHGLHTTLAYLI